MKYSDEKSVFDYALRILAKSAKSKAELVKRFKEKKVSEDLAQKVLERLAKLGYLNDRRLAENVRDRLIHSKPSGKKKIQFELSRRGVAASVQREVLEDYSAELEIESAHNIAIKKWKTLKDQDPVKKRNKLYAFLVRRGFDYEAAECVIHALHNNSD